LASRCAGPASPDTGPGRVAVSCSKPQPLNLLRDARLYLQLVRDVRVKRGDIDDNNAAKRIGTFGWIRGLVGGSLMCLRESAPRLTGGDLLLLDCHEPIGKLRRGFRHEMQAAIRHVGRFSPL